MLIQGERTFIETEDSKTKTKSNKNITHFRKIQVFSMVSIGSLGKITM